MQVSMEHIRVLLLPEVTQRHELGIPATVSLILDLPVEDPFIAFTHKWYYSPNNVMHIKSMAYEPQFIVLPERPRQRAIIVPGGNAGEERHVPLVEPVRIQSYGHVIPIRSFG